MPTILKVIACIVMTYMAMPYIVMAHIAMAYIVSSASMPAI